MDHETIAAECESHRHRVAKVITLSNATALLPLMEEGINVIHLVRDPRGEIRSIRGLTAEALFNSMSVTKMANYLCERTRSALELIQRSQTSRTHYRLVRYEDIAGEPFIYANLLYSFLGLEMNSNARKWINISTTSFDSSPWASVRKSPKGTSEAWRSKMSYDDVLAIEDECADVLYSLGYARAMSEGQLRDLKVPFVRPAHSTLIYHLFLK